MEYRVWTLFIWDIALEVVVRRSAQCPTSWLTPSRRLELIISNHSKPVRDFLRRILHFLQIRPNNKSVSRAVRGLRKLVKRTDQCSTRRGSSWFYFEGELCREEVIEWGLAWIWFPLIFMKEENLSEVMIECIPQTWDASHMLTKCPGRIFRFTDYIFK